VTTIVDEPMGRGSVAPMKRFSDRRIAAIFEAYPPILRRRLAALRALVLETAEQTDGVGRLTETVKWGQPSYLTEETGSGTTVRIDCLKAGDGYAIFFHCRSGLVDEFRQLYPDTFRFQGDRAIAFDVAQPLPARELGHCIALAFTHHARKRKQRRTLAASLGKTELFSTCECPAAFLQSIALHGPDWAIFCLDSAGPGLTSRESRLV
jgi:hypothetical protein